jgi:hypothetical protein
MEVKIKQGEMMSKFTKQGIRDLNNFGPTDKKNGNGRRDRGQQDCFHVFEEMVDDDYMIFKRCAKCSYEDV